jgi:23S rRNA (adenine2503-C2)-methyltransferase
MGMGEPLINADNVLAACERLPDIGISARRTAISTVGWIPGIEKLMADDAPKVRLALSVHAADEQTRTRLMPVNTRYPLPQVIEACLAWSRKRRQAVFVEYLMLEDVNDSEEQAHLLADVLRPKEAFKVNLIPYNPTDAAYTGSGRDAIASFKAALESRGLRATTRLTRGRDIDAACGQLAAKAAAPRPDPVAR